MQFMQILKSGLKPRRSFLATLVLVGVVASVMGLTPTKGASNTLAESCANPPAVPTFNYWPVTYNDANTPLCHDFPAIDAAVDVANPQFSQSEADYNDGLTLADGQRAAALLYLHNGAANNLDPAITTAKNVKIITETEQNVGDTHKIKVTYTADNAAPYTKSFTVKTSPNVKLEVAPNSGFMYNYEGRMILSQQNLNLGNSTYNLGDLDACFEFSIFLTFKFRAVVQTPPTPSNTTLSIDKQVKNITVDPNTGRGAVYSNSANAKQGEQVGYRVAVTNTGSAVAQNVTMTDNSVAGVSVNAGSTTVGTADDALLSSGWSGSVPGTVNLGNLNPGETRIVKYTATVTANNGTLVNTARAVATNAPQVQDDASVIVTPIIVPPVGNPGLTIKKLVKNNNQNTAFADSVSAKTGEWVRFQVTITNNGTANLTGARITDAIPAGLEFENTAVSNGNISFNNNTLIVIFDSAIPAGQSRSVEFNAQVKATGPTTICNVAVATGNNVAQVQDSACVNVTAPIIVGTPNLTISKLVKNNNHNTAFADSVDAKTGEWVRFQVTIANTGNADLTGARITDTIPAGLEFENTAVANDGTISFANGVLTVMYNGVVPAGHTRVLEFNAQVKATGNTTICNVAVGNGNNVAQVQDNACVRVMGTPNLAIQKWVKTGGAYADSVDAKTGERVTFKITITNTGTAELTGAVITDVMPTGLTFDDSVSTDGTSSFNNNTLTVSFASPLAIGQSKTVEFAAKVAATGPTTICNVAKATGNSVTQVQDDACVRVTAPPVVTNPKISIKKSVKNISTSGNYEDYSVDARTGERAGFKITVTNTGDTTLSNVKVTDVIPTGLEFNDSVSGDGTANFSGTTFTVDFGSMTAGQSKTVEFATKVLGTGPTTVCNIAKANASGVSEVQDDACVKIYTTPKPGDANIVLSKKAYNDTKNVDAVTVSAARGDYITYTLITTNNGTADKTNYVISDDLSQVLPLADMVSLNGGTLSGNMLTFPAITIKAGETVTKTFKVRVKQTLSAELSYQLKNTYGNTIVINVPGKTVYEAPTTGAAGTSAGIFAGLLTAGFVIARKRDSILKFVLNS